MKVKICGITRLEDAVTAVSFGADMLGFNFYKGSKRYISPKKAARLIHELRAVISGQWSAVSNQSPATDDQLLNTDYRLPAIVGVFVNSPLGEVQRIMSLCRLDLAQFSGDEPPETLGALRGKAFKAIRPSNPTEAQALVQQFALMPQEPAFLMDAYHPQEYGGTGRTSDWTLAAQFAQQYPMMLAGGLTPQNVATAVAQVKPWGVDVASGVESAPGIKDPEQMALFIKNSKQYSVDRSLITEN